MRKRVPRKQTGFLLLEFMVAMALTMSLGIYGAKAMVDAVEQGRTDAAGAYASTVGKGLDEFLNLNAQALSVGTPIAGVSNPLAPTIAELKAVARLPQSLPLIDPFRRHLVIAIDRSGCPGAGCMLSAYAYSDLPLTAGCTGFAVDGSCLGAQGQIRYVLAEDIRIKSGGYGATVSMLAPARFKGATCDYPAPPGASVGTYGICTTRNAAIYSQFVRIQDERDPDLQGNLSVVGKAKAGSLSSKSLSIDNGQVETTSINSSGDLTAKNGAGVATAGISMTDGSGRTYGRVIKPSSIQVKNATCVGTNQQGDIAQDSTGQGLVMCNGSIWIGISPEKDAIQGAWCSQNGAVAWNSQDIALYCSGNKWVLLADRFGKKVFADSYSAAHGSWIAKPACASGTVGSMIILTPKNQSTDAVKLNHYATENGSSWIISVVDNTGTPASGEAIAQTYCVY